MVKYCTSRLFCDFSTELASLSVIMDLFAIREPNVAASYFYPRPSPGMDYTWKIKSDDTIVIVVSSLLSRHLRHCFEVNTKYRRPLEDCIYAMHAFHDMDVYYVLLPTLS